MKMNTSELGIVRFVLRIGEVVDSGPRLTHVGMGMLLDERTIVTCSHVINDALARGKYEEQPPEDDAFVTVTFPILEDKKTAIARLVEWSCPGRNGLDCTILKLDEPAPSGVGHTILSVIPPQDLVGAELSVFGSPEIGHPGLHINASLLGKVGAEWSQFEVKNRFGVQPGFSGCAVWHPNQRTTVGMVIARQEGTEGLTVYFLPAQIMAERFFGIIPVEVRRTALGSQPTFTIIAAILFVLVLIHFLAMQGAGSSLLVPWADGSKELAAFFGAHCFAVILGPYVMWHAAQHSKSFAMRNWWQRVPAVFGGKTAAMLDHTPFSARMVILFLILLPAYGQGAFLNKVFFQERPVFVNIARFEETKNCVGGREKNFVPGCKDIGACQQTDPKWCKHENVDVWSFLKTFPYFDHVYQIAGTCETPTNCKMVTFFPLLQPLILFLATLFSYAYFFLFVWTLIRPWPHPVNFKKGE